MVDIQAQLARIEAKLDKITDDHEMRIRKLERVVYTAFGLAVAGAGAGGTSLLNTLLGGG